MKRILAGMWGCCFLVGALLGGIGCRESGSGRKSAGELTGSTAEVAKKAEDPIWIRVNSKEVFKSEVEAELEELRRSQGEGRLPPELENTFRRYAMQRAAQRKLLEEAAAKEGITVEAKELEEAVAAEKSAYPDEVYFEAMLKERGLTEEEFRKKIETNLRFQKYFEKKVPVPAPTDEEVRAFYENVKSEHPERLRQPAKVSVIHILLQFLSGSEEEKKQKRELAEKIRAQAEAGEDMGALAMKFSDLPSRSMGGQEVFVKGQMPPEFDRVVFSLKEGELSPVIETTIGCHLVKVLNQTPERLVSVVEIWPDIVEVLKAEKKKELYPRHVEELLRGAQIEYLEPLPPEPAFLSGETPGPESGSSAAEPGTNGPVENSVGKGTNATAPPPAPASEKGETTAPAEASPLPSAAPAPRPLVLPGDGTTIIPEVGASPAPSGETISH